MSGTDEDVLSVALHAWAGGGGADAKELNHEQIKLQNELADVLVLPDAFVDFWRQRADQLNV